VADLPPIDPVFAKAVAGDGTFEPYARDDRLARPWAVPGTPGLQHRIGGLEKADRTGNISYDGANHERMTELRAAKVAGIAGELPPLQVDHEDGARLLVLGWGSSEGPIRAGVRLARLGGHKVASAQLRHLNPLPSNTGEVLRAYDRVLVPEMNTGQLAQILRARYLVDVESLTKVQGQPLFSGEIQSAISLRAAGGSPAASPRGAGGPAEEST
jgi:2-oxoglutarate ferredoxin oxidoreductase subunit alpha